ncbi:hypothetical protein BJX61DRAFT_544885 [Aspergillus egyptiacus]|nr:hypothetical protein BJX61DRAFT_544885 [Aspergillus egyptiacus]
MGRLRSHTDPDKEMHSEARSTITEDSERLLDDTTSHDSWTYADEKRRRRDSWWMVGILIMSTTLACIAGQFIGRQTRDLNEICSRHVSHYSPVLSDVPIKYHRQQFNGSLLKENIFRQDAGPEVDAAWDSLGINYRPIRVPVEEAAKSGIAADQVHINPKYGGGYPANVEGLHHLHCLNLLRQTLYYNYDYYHARGEGAFKNNDFIVRRHVSHCLDILRQQLMCTIDTGVLGQVWLYPDHPKAFVDFNTEHQCRNFDEIRAWAERNQLPGDTPGDFLLPPGDGDRVFEAVP